MRCPHCGTVNRDEDTYCGECGTQLPSVAPDYGFNVDEQEDRPSTPVPSEDTKQVPTLSTPEHEATRRVTLPVFTDEPAEEPQVRPASPYMRPDGDEAASDTAPRTPRYMAPPRPQYEGEQAVAAKPSEQAHKQPSDGRGGKLNEQKLLWILVPVLLVIFLFAAFIFYRLTQDELPRETEAPTSSSTTNEFAGVVPAVTTSTTDPQTVSTTSTTELVIRYVSGTPTPIPTEPTTEETSETTEEPTTTEETTEEPTTTEVPTTTEEPTTETTTEPTTEATTVETTTEDTSPTEPLFVNDPSVTVPNQASAIDRDSAEAVEIDRRMTELLGYGTPGSQDNFQRTEIRALHRHPSDANIVYVEYYTFNYLVYEIGSGDNAIPYYRIYSNGALVGIADIGADMGSIRNAYNLPPPSRVYLNQLAETDIFLAQVTLTDTGISNARIRLMPGNQDALSHLRRLDAATGERPVVVRDGGNVPLYASVSNPDSQIGTLRGGQRVGALPFGSEAWMFIVDPQQGLVGYAERDLVE